MVQVLEGMGLEQYVAIIQKEALDGEIFLELDEKTLSQEMGVASKIHRIKLLKLISGDYDARDYVVGHATSWSV